MSKRSKILAGQMESIRATLLELDAIDEPTEEQVQQARAALDEFTTLEEQHRAAVEHEEEMERVRSYALAHPESRESGFAAPMVNIKRDPFEGLGHIRSMSDDELRGRALSATESVRYSGIGVDDEARESATRMIERVPGAAVLALATGSPNYMRAFQTWLASGGQPAYDPDEQTAIRAALSLTSANGGYMLMPYLLDPSLIRTGVAVRNPVRRIARVETGTVNSWHGVTVANVTTAWKGEGSAFTDGAPTTGEVTLTAAALTAYVPGSYELFQDSSMLNQLPGLIGEAIDYAESATFLTGSGSGAPLGVITAVSGTITSLVTATTRGTFDTTSAVDTIAMVNAVATRYEDNASWVMNKATHNKIKGQYTGTTGVPIVDMTQSNQVLNSPVYHASTITSSTTSGNIIAILGDWSQYVIYDRIGVQLEFMPNVVDGSGIPTGQRALLAFKRVGGTVSDINAFRLLKC